MRNGVASANIESNDSAWLACLFPSCFLSHFLASFLDPSVQLYFVPSHWFLLSKEKSNEAGFVKTKRVLFDPVQTVNVKVLPTRQELAAPTSCTHKEQTSPISLF